MSRSGFTFVETLTALVVVTAVMALGTPTFRNWLKRESVRGARQELTTHIAHARASAVQRGCPAVLHLDDTFARVWVTTCREQGVGTDTVGAVQDLSERFGITFAANGDSLIFTPQGVAFNASWLDITVSKAGYSNTIEISPVGNIVW